MKFQAFLWHFRKNRLNALVMIIGLVIAFSVTIYITEYVYSELSYDQSILDKDRIYRLYMDGELKDRTLNIAVTSPNLAVNIEDEIPEIESHTRINTIWRQLTLGDLKWNQQILRVDSNFFSFFNFKVLLKTSAQPLEDISSVMISERLANQLFEGPEKAIGKNIKLRQGDGYKDLFVGGVFENIDRFHFAVEMVQNVYVNKDFDSQTAEYIFTYIKTKEALTDRQAVDIKLTKSLYVHQYDMDEARGFNTFQEFMEADENYLFVLTEPLKDVHFSKHKFDNARTSNKVYIYGAIILALFVVVISFINYFNLSLASLSNRFKSFGVQRIIGASKKDIAKVFAKEGLAFFIIVFVLAFIVFRLIEEPFSQFTGLSINESVGNDINLLSIIGFVLLCLVLGSGFISYMIVTKLSSQKLVAKADHESLIRFANSRRVFMIIQFALSSFVIVVTLLVNKQITHFATADKGYDTDNIITFEAPNNDSGKYKTFVQELKKSPLINGVGTSTFIMGDDPNMGAFFFHGEDYFHGSHMTIDPGFSEVYDLELVKGRFFSESEGSGQEEVVINESAAKEYSLDGEILDDYIARDIGGEYKIVGVVKDFNYRTLHHPIEPLILFKGSTLHRFSVKVNNSKLDESIQVIRSTLQDIGMGENFSYQFVDDYLAQGYYKEAKFRTLLMLITTLAIFISCLGLFAISQISVLSKTKEIAIRKINGASIVEVLTMLNKSYLGYVLTAFVIASVIAWYAINKWQENFTYKTELSWWVFVFAGLMVLILAIFTVSWQSWKAASRNPVKALRYE